MSFSKNPTTVAGDFPYCDLTQTGAPGRLAKLAANTTATLKVLSETSSVPSWIEPSVTGTSITGGTTTPASNRLGETVSTGVVTVTNLASNTFTTIASRVIPGDGVYELNACFALVRNTTTASATNFGACIASATNSITGGVDGINLIYDESTAALTWGRCTINVGPIPVVYSGSTLTLPDGSTMTLTAHTLYATCRTGTFSGGTLPQAAVFFTITRIA